MLATFSSYFNRIKRQFFRTVENARSPCKRPLEDISEDEDDTQIQSYKPLRKKTCTTRDEMLPPITRSYQMKPILHWKPQPSPPLSTIKEDEPDVRDVRPDRKFFKTLRSPEVKESTSRQPPITTLFPVKPLSQVSTSSKIAPLKLSNRTIAPNKNNTSLGAWPRNCLKGCNYSVKNKKPLSTYTKRKPITISESFRIEEKQQYRQLLQHCTLSQSSSSLSSSQNVCQISPSSSSSSSPAMRDVRWSGNSSIESVPLDAGSESASPVFLGSNMSSRPSGKSKANRKEESENHQRPAIHQKSTRPKGPLPDMWQGLGNSRVKVKDKIESVIRSGSLHADDEEELSLGQLVRQRHHEKMAKNTIPVIDLCQSDSDSIESVKVLTDSESDSVEIVDEFPHNRRKTDVLQDLYDGKWMEAKHVEFNSIDQKAKSTDVEDREVLSEKNNQVNHLHEKVQKRLKQLDIIHTLPEKHTPAKAASQEQTFTPLTPEMQDEIEAALNPYPKSEVLIHKFNIKITRQDIATLNSLNWLNDEVVNFYMNLIMDRSMRNKRLPKVYVFSTFFYPKLFQSGHKSVSRWTKKVDIFSYDILLIPIHLDVHWCMATVDFKKRSINYYDSMLGDNPKCLKLLLEYLKDEHLDKKKASYPTVAWKLECTKNIPEQMNGSDCGMFSCKFAEFKSRQAPMLFTQEDMPYFRQRMVYEIIKGELLEG